MDSVDEMFFCGFLGLSWCLFWCFFAFSSSRCLVHFFVKGFGKKKHMAPFLGLFGSIRFVVGDF